MPGIVAIVGSGSPEANATTLRRMMDCMLHEPVYTSGTYFNEALGIWIGWINRPESFTDCMPVWNETHDVCLVFSGEDFADKSLTNDLRAGGHKFDSENATYLVHLYEEMGLNFIERLNGRFSGVLIDLRQQNIVIFNDRYGADRIYYHARPEGFFFSSEAKSLLTVFPELRNLDLTALAETFSFGCVLQNRTLYPKIELLPGGSLWTFTGRGKLTKTSYFARERWENQTSLSGEEYYKKLKQTFASVVPRYFQGKNKIGMSLTGGLDGRMIMAWANLPSGALPCYTFGDTHRDSTDVQIARRVAKLCSQPHQTIVVEPQFFQEFSSLAEKAIYISDGAMDVTGAVELYFNRVARRIAPVRLTGNYGSEIMRSNIAFRPAAPNKEILTPEFSQLVRTAAATYRSECGGHPVSFIAFKQVPWHHYSRLSVELSQVTMRSPYLDNDLVSLMYQAPPHLLLSKEPAFHLIADGNEKLATIPTDRGFLYRPVPFLTKCRQHYEEFTFRAEYAYDYGMPQWLARIDKTLIPLHLERLFLGRHKFHHFRVWYRDKLAQYLKDVLLEPRTLSRPYLNGRRLEKIVSDHTNGRRNHTREIHRVLTSELIQRTLIEQHA
jgi:asparagine synthase (glutamine-hydrolysing)